MRVFLTGANGWIGSAITRDLLRLGHTVVGLVRTPEKAAQFAAAGGTPVIGALENIEILRQGASDADGVIHTAFGLDISKIEQLAEEDNNAIDTFGEVFSGSDRPIMVSSGVFMTPPGEVCKEYARPPMIPGFPRASEQRAFALAERGLRASVVRNPRSVHGQGESHGFVPMLAAVARKTGVSAYVGDGQNLWPSVHRLDAARIYTLAIERGAQGEAYHAIAEEGIQFRRIAEAVGRQLGVPAKSLTSEQAEEHFGGLAIWVAGNGPASSEWTRKTLAWEPREASLISDIERPDYSA